MTNTKDENREVTFRVEKHLGVIRESSTGWTKELNLVSWRWKQSPLPTQSVSILE